MGAGWAGSLGGRGWLAGWLAVSCVFPMVSCVFPVVLLWFSYDIGVLWFSLVFPTVYYAFPMLGNIVFPPPLAPPRDWMKTYLFHMLSRVESKGSKVCVTVIYVPFAPQHYPAQFSCFFPMVFLRFPLVF